jgi:hypothetical protein
VVAVGAVSFLLVYTPQLLAYQALNGHPSQTILVSRKLTWTSPHFFEVLLSPQNGLFAWTPLAALALVGLAGLALLSGRGAGDRRPEGLRLQPPAVHPDAPWIGVCALLMVAGQVYISGAVESWTVAGSFGQRRFVALTPLLTLGLAAVFLAARPYRLARTGVAALVALCVWWNVGLMAQFGLHRMDRQRLALAHNAHQTFVVLPRELPGLAWRYVFDRASFYRLPRE